MGATTSDQFLGTSLGGHWTIDAQGGLGSDSVAGGLFTISIPAGDPDHDQYQNARRAYLALQAVTGDFDVALELDNYIFSGSYKIAGIYARGGASNTYARFDIYSENTTQSFFVYRRNPDAGTSNLTIYNASIGAATPNWLRVRRVGDDWTFFWSADGASWTTVATWTDTEFPVSDIGIIVGNASGASAPAHDASFEQWLDLSAPADPNVTLDATDGAETFAAAMTRDAAATMDVTDGAETFSAALALETERDVTLDATDGGETFAGTMTRDAAASMDATDGAESFSAELDREAAVTMDVTDGAETFVGTITQESSVILDATDGAEVFAATMTRDAALTMDITDGAETFSAVVVHPDQRSVTMDVTDGAETFAGQLDRQASATMDVADGAETFSAQMDRDAAATMDVTDGAETFSATLAHEGERSLTFDATDGAESFVAAITRDAAVTMAVTDGAESFSARIGGKGVSRIEARMLVIQDLVV